MVTRNRMSFPPTWRCWECECGGQYKNTGEQVSTPYPDVVALIYKCDKCGKEQVEPMD